MTNTLTVSLGQHSDAGRKQENQDFHGALIPDGAALAIKGIAVVLADGISTSAVGAVAAETAVKSFLTDYYCTPDSWSARTSAERVVAATNAWLHAQNRVGPGAEERDRGYVCTFDALVLKSRTAHLFHIGDGRIGRLRGRRVEPLTNDHRVIVSSKETYLGRALGANPYVEIDYLAVAIQPGDVFALATDGVYEHVRDAVIADLVAAHAHDLDAAARGIVAKAIEAGSPDNLTIQLVRVESAPDGQLEDLLGDPEGLPPPPILEARAKFEGYTIIRQLHTSNRSHIYLAEDLDAHALVAIKIPAIDARGDPETLRRLMMEEWIARRLDHPNIVKAPARSRPRAYLYAVTEYVEGQTLDQWMRDNPRPELAAVRRIVEQIASGLLALHRKQMLHQDLRPQNVMIDANGTVRIIDLGSVWVAGAAETGSAVTEATEVLGTVQFCAPEYLLGEGGTQSSDYFSLGVIAYQLLTGRLPYGVEAARVRSPAQLRALRYVPAREHDPSIPAWVDGAIARMVHPRPGKRYPELSEFTYDLRHPNPALSTMPAIPLARRNPVLLWQLVSAALLALLIFALWRT